MTKLQKDHLMILLESVDSKMQMTLETVCSLNDKIDGVENRLNAKIDSMDIVLRATVDEVASLHSKFDALDSKVDALDKKVDAVDRKVDAVDRKVDAVYDELVAHRNDTELHGSQRKRSLKRVA